MNIVLAGGVLLNRNGKGEEIEFSDEGADISDLFDSGPYGGGAVYNSKDIVDVEKGESNPAAAPVPPAPPYFPFPRGKPHTRGNIWSFTVG